MCMVKRLSPWLLTVALTACGDSFTPLPHELQRGAPVRITVPDGLYQPGASVPLSVHNEGGDAYVWNPCIRRLQGKQGDGWVFIDEGDRVCTLEGWYLEPGDRTDASTDTPGSLVAGEYRFMYSFSREGGDRFLEDYQVSNSFVITR